jgi:hypothetical protein
MVKSCTFPNASFLVNISCNLPAQFDTSALSESADEGHTVGDIPSRSQAEGPDSPCLPALLPPPSSPADTPCGTTPRATPAANITSAGHTQGTGEQGPRSPSPAQDLAVPVGSEG